MVQLVLVYRKTANKQTNKQTNKQSDYLDMYKVGQLTLV